MRSLEPIPVSNPLKRMSSGLHTKSELSWWMNKRRDAHM
jgi:hypothetical protein